MDLKNKVAFITGAVGALGKSITEGLLEHGVKVYMTDLDAKLGDSTLKEFQTKFGSDKVLFSVLDVTNDKQFQDAFNKAVVAFGRIDIMCNNAGVFNEMNLDLTLSVNLGGVIRGTRIAENHMRRDKKGNGGCIVNMCSIFGFLHPPLCAIYAATKHGVRAYTSCMAKQTLKSEQGLEYAALCPFFVDGGIARQVMDDTNCDPEFLEMNIKAQERVKRIPLSQVAEGFIELVTLERMNGALLIIDPQGMHYEKMQQVDLGTAYSPLTEYP